MILQVLVTLLAVYLCPEIKADLAGQCEIKAKTTANLDLAIHLLNMIKENYLNREQDISKPFCTLPMDCEDVLRNGQNKSGIYQVWPKSRAIRSPIEVFCDMETNGGGWTVFQRRGDFGRPKDFFYQDWESYKKGFGNIDKDFWLGNDNIFALSNQRLYSLRIDLQDVEGKRAYGQYDTFWIDDEIHLYTLHIKEFRGDAGDSMIAGHNHDGQKFTTKDRKNDNLETDPNCAVIYKGAWWYNACHGANLNGLYHKGKHESYADGVNWAGFRGLHESLEWTEMKIRSEAFPL